MLLAIKACETSGILNAIYIIKMVLKIIFTLVPLAIILTSIINLTKAIFNADNSKIKDAVYLMIAKIIVGAIIFMIPTLTNAILSLIDSGKVSNSYLACYNNATAEKIKEYKEKEEAEAKAEAEEKEKEKNKKLEEYEKQQQELDKNNHVVTNPNNDNDSQDSPQYNVGAGGNFVSDGSNGIYGHIVSSLDGKRHTIFRQSQISGWGQNCNRAAAASIASAYTTNEWTAVEAANQVGQGIGYEKSATDKYFSKFGLSAKITNIGGPYDNIKDSLLSNISNGNYVMFDLSEPHVNGKSGQNWTTTRHWLAILDVKKTSNGSYAIFVSDSGHQGSTKDYGLGAGWYDINEFSGQRIQYFTVISKK